MGVSLPGAGGAPGPLWLVLPPWQPQHLPAVRYGVQGGPLRELDLVGHLSLHPGPRGPREKPRASETRSGASGTLTLLHQPWRQETWERVSQKQGWAGVAKSHPASLHLLDHLGATRLKRGPKGWPAFPPSFLWFPL